MHLVAAIWLLFLGFAAGEPPSRSVSGPAYLVYAGPYSSSPASAFGHLFLVIRQDPDQPLPLWNVVSFSADIGGASPLSFLYHGVFGGFRGRYRELAFHEKTRDYASLEDRDLWLAELDLESRELLRLAEALARERGNTRPYTFFSRNCAYYLQAILARANEVIPPPSGTVSPLGVIDCVADRGLVRAWYRRPSASRHLADQLTKVSMSTRDVLEDRPWEELIADTTWTSRIPRGDRLVVQDFVSWKLLHRERALPASTERGLRHLRKVHTRTLEASRSSASRRRIGTPVTRPFFAPYSRLTISTRVFADRADRVCLRWRPAIRDERDPWVVDQPANTLEFATLGVSWAPRPSQWRVEEVTLFSQRSHAPINQVVQPRSWLLETVAERGGIFGWDAFHYVARAGVGQTRRPWGGGLLTGLVTVAVVGNSGDGVTLAPGAEISLLHLLAPELRWGLRGSYEFSAWQASEAQLQLRGWLRWDLSRRLGLHCAHMTDLDLGSTTVGVSWYH